jgi:hypothetical protein
MQFTRKSPSSAYETETALPSVRCGRCPCPCNHHHHLQLQGLHRTASSGVGCRTPSQVRPQHQQRRRRVGIAKKKATSNSRTGHTESAAARLVSAGVRLCCRPSPLHPPLVHSKSPTGHHHHHHHASQPHPSLRLQAAPPPVSPRFRAPRRRRRRGDGSGRRRCTPSCRGPPAGSSAAAGPPPLRTCKSPRLLPGCVAIPFAFLGLSGFR